MASTKIRNIILIIFSTFLISTFSLSQFQVRKVQRAVALNGQYITQVSKIQLKCISYDCGESIYYAQTQKQFQKTATIRFTRDKQAGQSLSFTTQTHRNNGFNYILFNIKVNRRIHQDEDFVLFCSITYLNRYINYPQSIDLVQDQKFQYQDNKNFLSPYRVLQSSVTYKFSKVIGYEPDGEKKGLTSVAFKGSNIEPFTYVSHRVHGVNNEPQVYFSEVIREIQVSHWGNIAITQFYKIKNIGPELKGQFSRVQFSSNNKFQAKNSWKGIETHLPHEIWGLYYRDQVGNISTSRAYRDDHNQVVRLALVPRYALLGGWKANWEVGYNLNTKGFLKHDGNKFQLSKIPIQYALSTILAQNYTIKVILPEGSTNTQIYIGNRPIDMQATTKGISFGYLDFTGRPTYTYQNVQGELKNLKLKINYEYEYTLLFKKPLIVFGAIFTILMLLVLLKRINMSAFEETHVKKIN